MVSSLNKCKTTQELKDKYDSILNSEYYTNSKVSIKVLKVILLNISNNY